jgi:hypothetical protein
MIAFDRATSTSPTPHLALALEPTRNYDRAIGTSLSN